MNEHEWFCGGHKMCFRRWPFVSQLLHEVLQGRVFEKVGIDVRCRSVSVVIYLLIAAGKNVLLGALVRAYMVVSFEWNLLYAYAISCL